MIKNLIKSKLIKLTTASLITVLSLAIISCSADSDSTEKREIVFGGLNWNSALVQNGIARYIVEHGYGHKTSQIEGATVPLFQGLRKGDVDITMEIWLPNQNVVWNEAIKAGEVIPVGKSLEDNWQSTFLIPSYVQDAHPELDSVDDLKEEKYKSLFAQADSNGKAVLYGCIAGWSCRGVQEGTEAGPGQIDAYGLADHVELRDPGTSGALAAAVEGAAAAGTAAVTWPIIRRIAFESEYLTQIINEIQQFSSLWEYLVL